MFVIPGLEKQRQADQWGLLGNQPSLCGEFQGSKTVQGKGGQQLRNDT